MVENVKSDSILVPVDFSGHSEAALILASELADCLGAPLTVLHVVHDPGEAPGFYAGQQGENSLRNMEDVASDMMQTFMRRMTEEHPGRGSIRSAEVEICTGLPVTRILEVADKLGARMIVMGSLGRSGLKHMMLGSKAERVVRLSPIPVTVVKSEA